MRAARPLLECRCTSPTTSTWLRCGKPLSQDAFARRIGVAVGTLRNWEQRRRRPEGPARVLLALLEKNPRLVEETLGG
jgi:putative transcriptional regulator